MHTMHGIHHLLLCFYSFRLEDVNLFPQSMNILLVPPRFLILKSKEIFSKSSYYHESFAAEAASQKGAERTQVTVVTQQG